MKKSDTIRKALGVTRVAYENIRHAHFSDWCKVQASENVLPARMLILSKPLYDWFCDKWVQKVELPFFQDNKDYWEASVTDVDSFRQLFASYVDAIEGYYPKPLLNQLKTQFKNNLKTV